MLDTIQDLKKRASEYQDNARKLLAAVDALQATCTHDWNETGYDPRKGDTFYTCSLCRAEKRT